MADFSLSYSNIVAFVANLKDNLNGSDIATKEYVNSQISKAQTSNKQPFPERSAEIVGGVLTIPRIERIQIIKVDTEGLTATDDIDQILSDSNTSFEDGDLVFFIQEAQARSFTFTKSNNVYPNGGSRTVNGAGSFAVFRFTNESPNGRWKEFPEVSLSLCMEPADKTISSGVITRSGEENYLRISGEPSGETLATAILTISTTPGTSGTMQTVVNDGTGWVTIGTRTYSGATLPAFEAPLLRDAINAGTATHGYSASASGGDVTVIAPVGSGSAPNNTWQMSVIFTGATGTPSWTSFVTFGTSGGSYPSHTDGVDGTPASDTLDTISGLVDGCVLAINNPMTGDNTITVSTSGNFATEYLINPGQTVWAIGNGLTSKWDFFDIFSERIFTKTVSISNAEILAINTTPKVLVSAFGPNTIIDPVSIILKYNYISATFSNTNLRAKHSAATDYILENDTVIAPALDTIEKMIPSTPQGAGLVQMVENSDLVLTEDTTDPTLGDGDLSAYICYRIQLT